ncbi:MAG: GumC family protein, partial [Lysobacteraceae bacterium]
MDNRNDNPAGEPEGRLPVPQSPAAASQALVPAPPGAQALVLGREANTPEEASDEIDLLAYWRILVKRKWWILSTTIAGLLLAVLMTLMATPLYLAAATVQVQERTTQVVHVGDTSPMRGGWSQRDFFSTQLELIRSRSLMQRVAADMGLTEGRELESLQPKSGWQNLMSRFGGGQAPAESDGGEESEQIPPEVRERWAIGQLLGGVSAAPVRESELVSIQFVSASPGFAVRAANAIAEGYVESNLERRFDSSSYAKTYLEERLEELKVKLQDSERELVEFGLKEQIVGTRGAEGTLAEQNLGSVNSAFAKARADRIGAETRWRQAQASTGAVLAGMSDAGELFKTLQTRRAELMAEYQTKLAVYKPDFPAMLELKAQIDEVERQIALETDAIKGAVKAEYDAALAQERTLAAMVEEIKAEVLDLQNRSIQYNILKREVDTNRELYDGLLQRYKEIGVAAGVSANNLSIVDRAEGAGRIKPNPSANMSIGLFLGVMFGIAIALLAEFLDDSVKSPEDVEGKLKLVNLGVVPRLPKQTTPQREQEDQRSAFAESYRSIRTALQFSTERGIPAVLAVTSTA